MSIESFEFVLAELVGRFLSSVGNLIPSEEFQKLELHLEDTPARMARMFWDELLRGYREDPKEILSAEFSESYDQFVVVRDIPFTSLCVHHWLNFSGKAYVAYLPDGKVVGLSKIPRLVECFSRRLQIQEALTEQIANALGECLRPKGVAVVIKAEHACMTIRGVQKPGTEMVTSCLLGTCRNDVAQRAEVFALMGVDR